MTEVPPNRVEAGHVRLRPYVSDKALIAWIDVLGASDFDKKDLIQLSTLLGSSSAIISGNLKSPQSDPKKSANALMIGDAICIAQNSDESVSRASVVTAAIQISRALFAMSYAHRGVILEGQVACGPGYSTLPGCEYITGRGVIQAVKRERSLKVTGLLVSEEVVAEVKTLRHTWEDTGFSLVGSIAGDRFLTSDKHCSEWKSFVDSRWQEHAYIAAAKSLTDQLSVPA